jgi:hypothetical protein
MTSTQVDVMISEDESDHNIFEIAIGKGIILDVTWLLNTG